MKEGSSSPTSDTQLQKSIILHINFAFLRPRQKIVYHINGIINCLYFHQSSFL